MITAADEAVAKIALVAVRHRKLMRDFQRARLGARATRHAEERPEVASRSTQDGGASFETPAAQAPQDEVEHSRRQEERRKDDLVGWAERSEPTIAQLAR